jgi:hypothetical protein
MEYALPCLILTYLSDLTMSFSGTGGILPSISLKKERHPCNSVVTVVDLDLVGSGTFLAKSDLDPEK